MAKVRAGAVMVNVGCCGFGDEGATQLAGALRFNATVKVLWINHNSIGEMGATQLADALRSNASVKMLDLRGNSIGAGGTTQLADALRSNATVEKLYLDNNSIGDEGAMQLDDALRTNTTVRVLSLLDRRDGQPHSWPADRPLVYRRIAAAVARNSKAHARALRRWKRRRTLLMCLLAARSLVDKGAPPQAQKKQNLLGGAVAGAAVAAAAGCGSSGGGSSGGGGGGGGGGAGATGAGKAPRIEFKPVPWSAFLRRYDVEQQATAGGAQAAGRNATMDSFLAWPDELWFGDADKVCGIFAYL
jgi:hypothetical protein